MNKSIKGRILSGHRPTGREHLGHLEGTLRNWVSLQDTYECFFEIADWHALTTTYRDTTALRQDIFEIVIDWLSVGIDPNKSVIFIQSQVPAHAVLHLLLSMIVPVSWLERNPTYKEWLELGYEANYGLLGYPVLQAADILIYKADTVPVGKDQVPHLELSREIARRFNYLYGKVFPEPQALLSEAAAVVPGIDGRKMSKSYDNAIYISDEPALINKKVMQMFTDPQKIYKGDPGHPEGCPVCALHKIYNLEMVANIEKFCRSGERGCVDCKQELSEKIIEALAPIQEKRKALQVEPAAVYEVISAGNAKASAVAKATLLEVYEALKLSPLEKRNLL